MAFIPAPLCILCEMVFELGDQRVENTIWARVDTAPSAVFLDNLAGALITWWDTEVRSAISQDCALVLVQCTYKGSATGPQGSSTAGLPMNGSVPTAAAPNGTAFVVKFGTANIGRSYRGRNYVAGLPASSIADSIYSINETNDVLGAYSSLTALLGGLNAEHVVVSFFTGGAARPAGVATPVTSYTATTRGTRSQRRRNPGIGS